MLRIVYVESFFLNLGQVIVLSIINQSTVGYNSVSLSVIDLLTVLISVRLV